MLTLVADLPVSVQRLSLLFGLLAALTGCARPSVTDATPPIAALAEAETPGTGEPEAAATPPEPTAADAPKAGPQSDDMVVADHDYEGSEWDRAPPAGEPGDGEPARHVGGGPDRRLDGVLAAPADHGWLVERDPYAIYLYVIIMRPDEPSLAAEAALRVALDTFLQQPGFGDPASLSPDAAFVVPVLEGPEVAIERLTLLDLALRYDALFAADVGAELSFDDPDGTYLIGTRTPFTAFGMPSGGPPDWAIALHGMRSEDIRCALRAARAAMLGGFQADDQVWLAPAPSDDTADVDIDARLAGVLMAMGEAVDGPAAPSSPGQIAARRCRLPTGLPTQPTVAPDEADGAESAPEASSSAVAPQAG